MPKSNLVALSEDRPPLNPMRRMISALRFFPKTHDFFNYYERSIQNILLGTKLMCELIANYDQRPVLVKALKEFEHVGDGITHELIDLLRETFLTPFDRYDMYQLAVKLDDILDIVYYAGNRLTRYNIKKMPPEVAKLAEIVVKATSELINAVSGLRSTKNRMQVQKSCIEVNRLENEADDMINHVVEDLFNNEWDAIQIIKIKEIVEKLEEATDKCEDVANIIDGIMLKNA